MKETDIIDPVKKFMQQTMQSRHWKHAERNNRLSL